MPPASRNNELYLFCFAMIIAVAATSIIETKERATATSFRKILMKRIIVNNATEISAIDKFVVASIGKRTSETIVATIRQTKIIPEII